MAARISTVTLAAVAAAGYHIVETAGLYNLSAADLRAKFDKHGIRTVSGHYPLADIEKSPDTVFATAKTLGQEYVTVPGSIRRCARRRPSPACPDALNKIGAAGEGRGLKTAYHNHDFEFQTYGASTTAMERLLAGTDPALVHFELDGYWAYKADSRSGRARREVSGPLRDGAPQGQHRRAGQGVRRRGQRRDRLPEVHHLPRARTACATPSSSATSHPTRSPASRRAISIWRRSCG
jgi:hypothetical protein